MKDKGNNKRKNLILLCGIVIAAVLSALGVTHTPESGVTADGPQTVYTAGVLATDPAEGEDLAQADSSVGESSEQVNPAAGEDPAQAAPAEGEDLAQAAPAEGEDPAQVTPDGAEESVNGTAQLPVANTEGRSESVPETVEDVLGDAASASWAEDPPQVYAFRNDRLLNQHYEKHGIEMGFATIEEYVAAANAVINHPDVLHKQEAEDNDDVYFLEATNEFVVVSTDGYIRTYFIASGGIDYYNRQ